MVSTPAGLYNEILGDTIEKKAVKEQILDTSPQNHSTEKENNI